MNENRVGALWYPDQASDRAPIAKGSIEIGGQKIPVVVWRNKWKQQGERTPDLYIERDCPRDGTPQHDTPEARRPVPERRQTAEEQAQARRERDGVPPPRDDFQDEIPF